MGLKVILAIMGKSGAGKDTLQKRICKDFKFVNPIISCTTRPKRDYEQEGVDYYYLTEEQFFKKINNNEMLEYTVFRDWFYGTDILSLQDGINVGVYNPEGFQNLLAKQSDNLQVFGIYLEVDDKIRMLRSLNREEHPDVEEVCRRFFADKEDFKSLDAKEWEDVLYWRNDNAEDFKTIMNKLTNIIFGQ